MAMSEGLMLFVRLLLSCCRKGEEFGAFLDRGFLLGWSLGGLLRGPESGGWGMNSLMKL